MTVNDSESRTLAQSILERLDLLELIDFQSVPDNASSYDHIVDAMFAVQWLHRNSDDSTNVICLWHRVPRKQGNSGAFHGVRGRDILRYGMEIVSLVGVENSYEFYSRRIPISAVKKYIADGIDVELLTALITSEPRPIAYGGYGYVNHGDEHSDVLEWDI